MRWEGANESFKELPPGYAKDMTWLWRNRGAVTGSAAFPPLLKMMKGGKNVTGEQPILLINVGL